METKIEYSRPSLERIDNINVNFITMNRPELSKFNAFDKIDPSEAVVLYFSDKATRDDIKNFENYIKENSLGYYNLSKNLFEKQDISNAYYIQGRLDLFIAFAVVVFFSLVAIGLVLL